MIVQNWNRKGTNSLGRRCQAGVETHGGWISENCYLLITRIERNCHGFVSIFHNAYAIMMVENDLIASKRNNRRVGQACLPKYMKKKLLIGTLVLAVLFGVGAFTYSSYAAEKEKREAAAIVEQARQEAERVRLEAEAVQRAKDEAFVAEWADRIYPGVSVMGIDLSGLTRAEALDVFADDVLEKVQENALTVMAKGQEFMLYYEDLELELDLLQLMNDAMAFGKDWTFEEKLEQIRNGERIQELSVDYRYGDEPVLAFVRSVADAVDVPARNASITRSGGTFNITAHTNGQVVDQELLVAEMKAALDGKENKTVEAQIVTSSPKITAESLSKINGELASYSTSFAGSIPGRVNNIGVAARSISQTLLMPGEVFSYNDTLGPINIASGYQNAGIFLNGRLDEGIGGGICQVSSTLYQSVLHSGLEIVQRRNHSMKVSYLPAGLDAVVYGPYLDLKFRNSYPSPILVTSHVSGSTLTVTVYGNKADMGGRSYRIFSEVNNVIEPEEIIEKDPTMFVGQREVTQDPVTGYRSTTYKQTIQNGSVVKTEVISVDNYRKVDKIVREGTKPVPQPTPEPPETPQPEPPEEPGDSENP